MNFHSRFGLAAIIISLGIILVISLFHTPNTNIPQFFNLLCGILFFTITNILYCSSLKSISFILNIGDAGLLLLFIWTSVSYFSSGQMGQTDYRIWLLLLLLYVNIRIFVGVEKQNATNGITLLFLLLGLAELYISFRQLYGFSRSNHNLYSITGSFHNPAPLGGFLAMVCGVAVYQGITSYRIIKESGFLNFKKTFLWEPMLFGLSCLYLVGALLLLPSTMSRIGWIAAIVAVCGAIIAAGYGRKLSIWIGHHKKTSVALTGGLLLLCIAGGIMMYNLKKDSADGRLLMWKISAKSIVENPITGVGLGQFSGAYGETQADYFESGAGTEQEKQIAGSTGSAFNDYLQLSVELGLIGLALFIGILIFAFRGFVSAESSNKGFAFGLIAFCIFAMASYPLMLTPLRLLLMIFLGVGISFLPAKSGFKLHRKGVIVLLTVMALVNVFVIHKIHPEKASYLQWKQLSQLYRMQQYETIVLDYEELYHILNKEPSFLFEYGNILNKTKSFEKSLEVLHQLLPLTSDPMVYNLIGNNYKELGHWNEAEKCYWRAYYVVPNRIYPLYLLTQLYQDSGQLEKMRELGKKVLKFQEKVPSQAVEEMKDNVRKLLILVEE